MNAERIPMRKAVRMNARNGFSLLEVVIALTILFVGILGAMQFVPAALRNSRRAVERETAARTVQNGVSVLRAEGAERLFRDVGQHNTRLADRLRNRILQPGVAASVYDQADWRLLETSPRLLFSGYDATISQMTGAQEVYLQRVTMRLRMADGRLEEFVTYVARE